MASIISNTPDVLLTSRLWEVTSHSKSQIGQGAVQPQLAAISPAARSCAFLLN
jgi:hypothetical protein